MFDTIKDILSLFLGAAILLISVIFVPEVKASKRLKYFCWIGSILMVALGIDSLLRNGKEQEDLTNRIQKTQAACESTTDRLRRDSASNATFQKHLDSLIHSKDSATIPPQVKKYYQEFKKGSIANFY